MAVDGGDVLRIRRHDVPEARDNFLRLVRDDFRIDPDRSARSMIAAALALHSEFGEPDVSPVEMRMEVRNGEYVFVDGERFGKVTGFRIRVDPEGRPTAFGSSRELDTEPLDNPD